MIHKTIQSPKYRGIATIFNAVILFEWDKCSARFFNSPYASFLFSNPICVFTKQIIRNSQIGAMTPLASIKSSISFLRTILWLTKKNHGNTPEDLPIFPYMFWIILYILNVSQILVIPQREFFLPFDWEYYI